MSDIPPPANVLSVAPEWWVQRQHLGVWTLVASYLFAAVAIFAEMLRGQAHELPAMAMHLLRTVPLFGLSAAVWMLTSMRPNTPMKLAKSIVRWGFVAMLTLAVVMPILQKTNVSVAVLQAGWTSFFGLLIVCWIGLGCIQVRVARMIGVPRLGILIWCGSIAWSIALIMTASFYVFREFTERMLFTRAEPLYVNTLLISGLLLVMSTLILAIAFSLRMRKPA